MSSGPTIINKTKPKKPRFVWQGVPDNMTPRQKEKFWKTEEKRWHEGYKPHGQERMDGMLYFYLTQVHIIDPHGRTVLPSWRDVEEDVIWAYRQAEKDNKDLANFKRRRMGLSTFFGAGMPLYKFYTKPGSTSLMTSADRGRTSGLFNQKLLPAWKNMHPDIKPDKISRDRGGMTLEVEMRDYEVFFADAKAKAANDLSFGQVTNNVSACRCRQTSDGPGSVANFEGEAAVHLFIDELFLHPYAGKVMASNEPTMSDGFMKTAPIVVGGSAGLDVQPEGMAEAKRLWDSKSVQRLFIPGWQGIVEAPEYDDEGNPTGKILNFCENGHSDKEGAMEWIKKRRAYHEKYSSETKQLAFMKMYPLEINEIFEFNNTGVIPEDIAPRISKRSIYLVNNPPSVFKCRLFEQSGKVKMERDPKGDWTIYETPQTGATYGMGSDPIPMVDTDAMDTQKAIESKKRSVHASIIGKYEANLPVAYYQKRTTDPAIILNDLTLGQRYYNDCQNMLERNQGRVLIREYELKGLNDMLAKQPIIFGPLEMDKKRYRGYSKNHSTTDTLYKTLWEGLRRGIEDIPFLELVDQFKDFLVFNTDLVDAYVSLMVLFEDMRQRASQKTSSKFDVQFEEIVYYEPNGKGGLDRKVLRVPMADIRDVDYENLDTEAKRTYNKLDHGVLVWDTRGGR